MAVNLKLQKRIKHLMLDRDINQKTLSEKTGLSEASISNFLSGQTDDVRYSTLVSIAAALKCDLKVLFRKIKDNE